MLSFCLHFLPPFEETSFSPLGVYKDVSHEIYYDLFILPYEIASCFYCTLHVRKTGNINCAWI